MIQATDWASREQTLHSYELISRYVMPHFQGSVKSLIHSQKWSAAKREELGLARSAALQKATQDYKETRTN